jgi:hypothetical protein
VEVDTMDLRRVPGAVLKQFTARDVVSRWDVVEVRHPGLSPGDVQEIRAEGAPAAHPM